VPGRVRTRFAPSPTGFLHIGGVRAALYAWAFAKHHGGDYVLRIEDTDVERSTPEAVAAILEGLDWLGLDADEGPFYQMQRMDRYRQLLDEMLADGRAYYRHATPAEREAAWRGPPWGAERVPGARCSSTAPPPTSTWAEI